MSERTLKDAGEEKSHRKIETDDEFGLAMQRKTPDVLPSTASESPGKTRHESQSLLSPQTEQHYRTERPVAHDRLGRLVDEQPPGLFTEHTDRFIVENDKMNSYPEAES